MKRVFKKTNNQSGSLLLEVLVAIAAAAVVVTLVSQSTYVSLYGSRAATEKSVALGIAEEVFEGINSASTEKWQNLYNLTKNSVVYSVATSTNKWVINSGSKVVTVDTKNYTQSFIVENVCRDNSTRDLTGITDASGTAETCTSSGGIHDPSTQKITITVSWQGSEPLTMINYITRWKNKTCDQTDWSGGVSSGASTCPDNKYGGKTNIDATTDLKLCSGGC